MECPYCDTGRSFIPGAKMCANCKATFDSDDIDIGSTKILQGHTHECAYNITKTNICTCEKKKQ